MRTLHLVDIENLLRDPEFRHHAFDATFASYLALSGWKQGDHVAIAANFKLAKQIAWSVQVPHSLLVASCGPDAADIRLLDWATGGWVTDRFDRVVVGSGDGIFAPLAERLGRAGLATAVVAEPDSLSTRLRSSVHEVCVLEMFDDTSNVPSVAKPCSDQPSPDLRNRIVTVSAG